MNFVVDRELTADPPCSFEEKAALVVSKPPPPPIGGSFAHVARACGGDPFRAGGAIVHDGSQTEEEHAEV
jgi:hypothetical protein